VVVSLFFCQAAMSLSPQALQSSGLMTPLALCLFLSWQGSGALLEGWAAGVDTAIVCGALQDEALGPDKLHSEAQIIDRFRRGAFQA